MTPWWVKVVDEVRAEAAAFGEALRTARTKPPKKPEIPGARTVRAVRKKAGKVKRNVTRSPASRFHSAQTKARNTKVAKATTIRTVTPVKMNSEKASDGYREHHADVGDMTGGERFAARYARTIKRGEDAYWQQRGEWAVKWTSPLGLRQEERFATANEAYWFCRGQNGALPRRVMGDDRLRFTVGIYYRDEDEYTDPWGPDALNNLARKGSEQAWESNRDDVYGKQLGRDLRSHSDTHGGVSGGSMLRELWATGRRS